jgi:hypothetical protein
VTKPSSRTTQCLRHPSRDTVDISKVCTFRPESHRGGLQSAHTKHIINPRYCRRIGYHEANKSHTSTVCPHQQIPSQACPLPPTISYCPMFPFPLRFTSIMNRGSWIMISRVIPVNTPLPPRAPLRDNHSRWPLIARNDPPRVWPPDQQLSARVPLKVVMGVSVDMVVCGYGCGCGYGVCVWLWTWERERGRQGQRQEQQPKR